MATADSLDNFRLNDALPAAWYKVRPSDNTLSGYNRRHIAPSAERTRNEANNHITFLISNMMLQVAKLNRRAWRDLHKSCCN
ncbi:DNA/RNA non-specific endonuclease [Microcoleus sp. Pol7_A1]|uniref:DNA/RNA non-specific endonuclease n=1 Tax=Microcoleus sp. Pol7_A1 TaxID=2818893 RepID=UPI0040408750